MSNVHSSSETDVEQKSVGGVTRSARPPSSWSWSSWHLDMNTSVNLNPQVERNIKFLKEGLEKYLTLVTSEPEYKKLLHRKLQIGQLFGQTYPRVYRKLRPIFVSLNEIVGLLLTFV